MGMSRGAVGYYKRPQAYVDKASYRIKEKLCQQSQLAKKVLFPEKKISSRLIFQDDSPFGDLRNYPREIAITVTTLYPCKRCTAELER